MYERDKRTVNQILQEWSDEPVSEAARATFKIEPEIWRLIEKELGGFPELLFLKKQRKQLETAIADRERFVREVFGKDNVPDAQDYIAYHPRQAFNMWLNNFHKLLPSFQKWIQSIGDEDIIAIAFYTVISALVGKDMAYDILKKYFVDPKKLAATPRSNVEQPFEVEMTGRNNAIEKFGILGRAISFAESRMNERRYGYNRIIIYMGPKDSLNHRSISWGVDYDHRLKDWVGPFENVGNIVDFERKANEAVSIALANRKRRP